MGIIGFNARINIPGHREENGTILSNPVIGDDSSYWFIAVLDNQRVRMIDIDHITVAPIKSLL